MTLKKFILVLDIGSTSGRGFVFELPNFNIVGKARFDKNVVENDDGHIEINPEDLFQNVIKVLRDAIVDAQISATDILCLGISVQRATFITFDKVTGRPFHNFCTWEDNRAASEIRKFNDSFLLKFINSTAAILHLITRKQRFKQGSNFKFQNSFMTPKLKHIIDNNEKIKEAMKNGRVVAATLDTWLLFRLKNFQQSVEKFELITDISNAASTSYYDPFELKYNKDLLKLFKINKIIRPKVVDNSYDFGYTHKSLFGEAIKIATIISDQSASLIGNACFRKMDAKITIGTSSVFNINTGNKCMGSKNGSAPLIAYDLTSKRKRKWIVFMTERSFAHSSAIIKFATTVGLCKDPNELSDIAFSVPDTDGVHFLANIPSMAGFIGVKSSTKSSHLVRAILESIIFNIALLFFLTKEESSDKFDRVRIDGGISQNDFVCQTIADLINVKIERGVNASEITSVGVAYLSAYLSNEVLEELEQAEHKYKVDRVFWPIDANRKKLFLRFKKFENLLQKFKRVEE